MPQDMPCICEDDDIKKLKDFMKIKSFIWINMVRQMLQDFMPDTETLTDEGSLNAPQKAHTLTTGMDHSLQSLKD